MSLVNTTQVNETAINAAAGGIKDAYMVASCTSGGHFSETRLVSTVMSAQIHSDAAITNPSIIHGANILFNCVAGGKLKLVIPIWLSAVFDATSGGSLQASEIFNMSTTMSSTAGGEITKTSVLRKGNPAIVFVLHSLQYLNSGIITINKNKYL